MKKKNLIITCSVIALLLMILTSCSNTGNGPIKKQKYMAVQVDKGDCWSIIDENGEIVVKEEYDSNDEVSKIYDEVYWVKSGDKFQLFSVDSPKKPLDDEQWDYATEIIEDRALVAKAGSPIQIINEKGKVVATLSKDIVEIERNNTSHFIFKKSEGQYGWADKDGNIIKDGLTSVTLGEGDIAAIALTKEGSNRYSIFDIKGNETGTFTADEVIAINNGYIGIIKGEKAYLIDKKGETVIESKKNKVILPPMFDYCVTINSERRFGILNLKGEEVIRPKYAFIMPMDGDLFAAMKEENKVGIINKADEQILDFDYESVEVLGDNFLIKDSGGWIVMDRNGKRIGKQEFYKHSTSPCNNIIHYINVDGLAEAVISLVPEFNAQNTISKIAAKLEKKPSDEFNNTDHFSTAKTLAGQVATIYYTFSCYGLSEEKFHEETKNDGWFDNVVQVSDGWIWKEDAHMTNLTVIFPTIEGDVHQTMEILISRIIQNGYKKSDYNEHIVLKDNHRIAFDTYGDGIKAEIDVQDDDPGC